MGSVAEVFGPFATGVIMTGMGQDGVEGCRAIMEAGGIVFGQDAATSVVYGMNKLAFSLGLVQEQFSVTSAGRVLHRRIQELLRGQAALVNGIQPPLSLHR
jgi:two-component system chemotaxis response regulator CheB